MKRKISLAVMVCASLVLLMAKPALSAAAAPTKVYEFNLSNYQQATAPQGIFLEAWADKINKESNGRIKIRVYHGGVLLPPNNVWPGVAKGAADLGLGFRYETFGKTFQEYIGNFMIGAPTATVAQQIQYDCYEKFPELRAEWKDNKVIIFASSPRMNMHNSVKPLILPADLKGLQIRVSVGGAAELTKIWGGIPVFAPITESYEMLQKKVVQGIMAGSDVLKTFRLAEVCNYTTNLGVQFDPSLSLCMNWEKFNSLPPDLQKVIDDSIPWARQNLQKAMDQQVEVGIDFAKGLGKGHQFYDPTPEGLAQWIDPIKPLLEKWAGSVDAKGLPGTALYNFVRERVKAYSK
jgi:TRAP-type C4-dicarboxylate transport system substrate-binding protein